MSVLDGGAIGKGLVVDGYLQVVKMVQRWSAGFSLSVGV